MAAPIIDGITAPSTVEPGDSFTVRIDAHDPDEKSGTLQGNVRDAAGNVTQALVQISISDPIAYDLEDDGTGFSIEQDTADPSLFHVTAPGG